MISQALHQKIQTYIETNVGIQLPEHKRSLIESRLVKRQKILQFVSLEAYVEHAISEHSDETLEFIDALTTNKTNFFREQAHFDFIQSFISERSSFANKTLHVWCAGCSSGEEAYTLGIILSELVEQGLISDYRIDATDISKSSLIAAASALYHEGDIAPISESRRKKYLLRGINQAKGTFKLVKSIRKRISFESFNLVCTKLNRPRHYDIILCRNVMIYFGAEQRTRLVDQFWQQLTPNGLFFVGHSEGITNLRSKFKQVVAAGYQKLGDKSA